MTETQWEKVDYKFRFEGDSFLRDLTATERLAFAQRNGIARVAFWADVNSAGVDVIEAAAFIGCGCLKERFRVAPGMQRLEVTLNVHFSAPRRLIVQLKRFGPGRDSWCRAGVSAISFEVAELEELHMQGAFPLRVVYVSATRKRPADALVDAASDSEASTEGADSPTQTKSFLAVDFILTRLVRMLDVKDLMKVSQLCRSVRDVMSSRRLWEKAYLAKFEEIRCEMPAWLSFWTDAVLVRGLHKDAEVAKGGLSSVESQRERRGQTPTVRTIDLSHFPKTALDNLLLETTIFVRGSRSDTCSIEMKDDPYAISTFHPRLDEGWLGHRRLLPLHSAPKKNVSFSCQAQWLTEPSFIFLWRDFSHKL